MTRGGRQADDLPVYDAVDPDPSSGPAGPHPPIARSAGGSSLGPGRGAGIAAVVLVVLVAGIALGDMTATVDHTGSPGASDPPSTIARTPAPSSTAPPAITAPSAITSADPRASSGPMVTPAVPCGSASPSADTGVALVVGGAAPVAGATEPVPAEVTTIPPGVPVVHVPIGTSALLAIEGEACAVAWKLDYRDPVAGGTFENDALDNPTGDPAVAAQNRWPVLIHIDTLLVADFHFADGTDIERSWRIIADPFVVPVAFLIGPDGSRVAARAGCGLSIALANGYASDGSCGSIGYPDGLAVLHVPAYRPVRFEIPGWDLRSWAGKCGQILRSGQDPQTFDDPTGCDLGGASSESGSALQDPAAFLIPTGTWVIRITVSAIREGDRLSVDFYAPVVAK